MWRVSCARSATLAGVGTAAGCGRVGEVGGHRRLERVPRAHDGTRVGAGAGLPLHEGADRAVIGDQFLEHGVRAARERLLLALHEPHRLERIARGARREDLRADQHRRDRGEPEAQAPGDAEQRRMRTPPGRRRGSRESRWWQALRASFVCMRHKSQPKRRTSHSVLERPGIMRAAPGCLPRPASHKCREDCGCAAQCGRRGRAPGGASGRGEMRSMSYTRAIDEERREA